MKAIRIFRHIECEGPAYLQTILDEHNIPVDLIRIDAGDQVNEELESVCGLIFMGGSMSVNDSLDWIAKETRLIQHAIEKDIPVMGLCLGSQLIARAMGACVYPGRHACMEIGWGKVKTHPVDGWSNSLSDEVMVFHWHGETFDLPVGAQRLFSNELYDNQGFTLGPHLALQCHLEMTEQSIHEWLELYPEDLARRCDRAHDKQAILNQTAMNLDAMQQQARILFNQWLAHCDA